MLKRFTVVAALTFFVLSGFKINAQAPYFQQEVHYKIQVLLDDTLHQLSGQLDLRYHHNGQEPLEELYFHVWGNAFLNPGTAFGRQKARQGDTKFYFSKPEQRGGYENLDFMLNGQSLNWALLENDPDIALVQLRAPLMPGDSLRLIIPFVLRIPDSFSRLGKVGQSYQLTQWYPKPAVYDRDGWHPMPYLDQGEFYSEFGSFDVSITLPANYRVGATGTLQTESERDWLLELAADARAAFDRGDVPGDEAFPQSSQKLKTIRYTAERVHDFAWFADKRFEVLFQPFALPAGDSIEAWAFFTGQEASLWEKAPTYLERSVMFYSEAVGPYPYPQVTAVQSALSAGAGMEYPMITVIGLSGSARSLDEVITHEVGHNWFYGILASNERVHPWLDEGLNSYYEQRYMAAYYEPENLFDQLPGFFTRHSDLSDLSTAAFLFQARRRLGQAPATHSDSLSQINYGVAVYLTPALAMELMEAYLGREALDQGMQAYYETWKFKHPQPEDFRKVLEAELSQDLNWFFDGLIGSSGGSDYVLQKSEKGRRGMWELSVKNRKGISSPYAIGAYKKGELVLTQWYTGHEGSLTRSFPAGDYDYFVLDPEEKLLERSRKRHIQGPKTPKPNPEAPALKFLLGLDNTRKEQMFWAPALAWNTYNGIQLGLLAHNIGLLERPFEFVLAPMVSTANGTLTGLADLRYHLYPQTGIVRRATLGLSGRTAHYNYLENQDLYLRFYRIQPHLQLDLKHPLMHGFQHRVGVRSTLVGEDWPVFDSPDVVSLTPYSSWNHEGYYEAANLRTLHPWSVFGALEQQSYVLPIGDPVQQRFLRLSLEGQYAYTYKPGKRLYARGFVGLMLDNSARNRGGMFPGAFNLTGQGHRLYNDYRYDEFFFARNAGEGFWSRQVSIRDAGFKVPLPSAYRNVAGSSNSWMMAANFKADLPFGIPIRPFLDLAYSADNQPLGAGKDIYDQIWWSGGLCIELLDNRLGVYLPLVQSRNIRDLYFQAHGDAFWQRLSFQINLQGLHPDEIRNRFW